MLRSSSGSRKLVTGFNEHRHGDMWLVLMSVWFNIRTDHCRASLTCWLTSWAQCTLDRQKGEELKVQRPPSCGISHLGIDLGGGGGVTQECETSQGCVSCAFHCQEASSVWYYPCVLVYMSCCLQVVLNPVSELKVQMGPWSVLWTTIWSTHGFVVLSIC